MKILITGLAGGCMKTDLKIGDTFEYRGKVYEVVEQKERNLCRGCFAALATLNLCMDLPFCSGKVCSDGRNRIFVEVKDEPI